MTGKECMSKAILWAIVGGIIGYQEGISILLLLGIGTLQLYTLRKFYINVTHRKDILAHFLELKWIHSFNKTAKKLEDGFIWYSHQKQIITNLRKKNPDNWAMPIYQKALDKWFKELKKILRQTTLEEKENLIYWLEIEKATQDIPFILASELSELLKVHNLYMTPCYEEEKLTYNSFPSFSGYQSAASSNLSLQSDTSLHKRVSLILK